MADKTIQTKVDNKPLEYYIIGNIINLVNHYQKQKIELRAYNAQNDKMIGMCDFAISARNNISTLLYIEVNPQFRQKHIGNALIKITHSYLAKKGVEQICGIFSPDPMANWAAENFYRTNNYSVMMDAELLFRHIKKEDKIPHEDVKWNITTVHTKAKLQALEEITVSPATFDNENERSLTLKK